MSPEDEVESLIRRRRLARERKARRNLILVASAVAVLLAVAAAFARWPGRIAGGRAAADLEEKTKRMTYAEVLDALHRDGWYSVHMRPTNRGQFFSFGMSEGDCYVSAIAYDDIHPHLHESCLVMHKHATAQAARQSAGSTESGTESYGVFTIHAKDPALIGRVKHALDAALR